MDTPEDRRQPRLAEVVRDRNRGQVVSVFERDRRLLEFLHDLGIGRA